MWGCNKVYVGETKISVGERIKEHTTKIASNFSAVAERYQKTGHGPDLDIIKVLFTRKVHKAIFVKK